MLRPLLRKDVLTETNSECIEIKYWAKALALKEKHISEDQIGYSENCALRRLPDGSQQGIELILAKTDSNTLYTIDGWRDYGRRE